MELSKDKGKKHKKKKRRKRSKSKSKKDSNIKDSSAPEPITIEETVNKIKEESRYTSAPQNTTKVVTDGGRCRDCLMEHCGKMQQSYDQDRTLIDFR